MPNLVGTKTCHYFPGSGNLIYLSLQLAIWHLYWHHPTPSTHSEYSEGNLCLNLKRSIHKKKVHHLHHTLPGIICCFMTFRFWLIDSGAEIVYWLISLSSDTWPLSKARGFGSETASKENWQLLCHILPRPRWLANYFFSLALLCLSDIRSLFLWLGANVLLSKIFL